MIKLFIGLSVVAISLLAICAATAIFASEFLLPIGIGCGVIFLLLVLVMFLALRAQKAGEGIESGMKAQGSRQKDTARPEELAELERIQGNFEQAVKRLKPGRFQSSALYSLPWYMMIGPPGGGKSTAMRSSGLHFDHLSDDGRGLKGVGGTENCEWWLTNDAVLLDTAGRYTEGHDEGEWLGFLDLLRKHRRSQPLNGIIVAVDVNSLVGATEATIDILAERLRTNVAQVVSRLDVIVPVYLLFTKCDKIPGFTETFSELRPETRKGIWGFTLDLAESARAGDAFEREFRVLRAALERRMLERVADEGRDEIRDEVYRFPDEFRRLQMPLAYFAHQLFDPTRRRKDAPVWRGAYFTSGTQDVARDVQVRSSMEEAAAQFANPHAPPSYRRDPVAAAPSAAPAKEFRSYFLHDLFEQVVIADRKIARRTHRAAQRTRVMAYSVGGASLAIAAAAVFGPVRAYQANRDLLAEAARGIDSVVNHPSRVAGRPISVEVIDPIRSLRAELAREPEEFGWWLDQREGLREPVAELFRQIVRRDVITPVVRSTEPTMSQFILVHGADDGRAPDDGLHEEYRNRLKLYLRLTTQLPSDMPEPALDEHESKWLIDEIVDVWGRGVAQGTTPEQRQRMQEIASGFVEGLQTRPGLKLERDGRLVAGVRNVLNRRPAAEIRLDQLIREAKRHGSDIRLASIVSSTRIRSRDGFVRAAFTREAWNDFFRHRLYGEQEIEAGGDWVLNNSQAWTSNQKVRELQDMRARFFDAYIREWKTFIASIEIDPGLEDAVLLETYNELTREGGQSLRGLFQHLRWHTNLVDPPAPVDLAEAEGDQPDPNAGLAEMALKKAGKVGKVLKKVDKARKRGGGKGEAELERVENPRATAARVKSTFEGLVGFGAPPEPPPPPADGSPPPPAPPGNVVLPTYIEMLGTIRSAFRARLDHPSDKATQQALADAVKSADERLNSIIESQKPGARNTLRKWLKPPIEAMVQRVRGDTVAGVATSWCDVVSAFNRTIKPHYPFDRSGRHDASLADVTAFFHPDEGMLWTFYNGYLVSGVLRRDDKFVLAERGEGDSLRYLPDLVRFLNRARDVSTVLFAGGGSDPQMLFNVAIRATPGFASLAFSVDGQELDYSNGPRITKLMAWPGTSDIRGAAIRGRSRNGVDDVKKDGEWAFFKLLESGATRGRAGQDFLTFTWTLRNPSPVDVRVDIEPRRKATPVFGVPERPQPLMGVFRHPQLDIPRRILQGARMCPRR